MGPLYPSIVYAFIDIIIKIDFFLCDRSFWCLMPLPGHLRPSPTPNNTPPPLPAENQKHNQFRKCCSFSLPCSSVFCIIWLEAMMNWKTFFMFFRTVFDIRDRKLLAFWRSSFFFVNHRPKNKDWTDMMASEMQYQMAMEVKMKTQNSRQKYYSVSGQNTTLRQLIGNNSSEVRTAIFGSEIRKEQFALFFVRQTTQWSGSELCIYSLVCGTWHSNQCKIWIGKIEILVLGSVDCAPFDWTLHWTAACMVLKSCFKVAIDTGRPRTYKILSKGKFYFIISTQNLDLPFTVFFYVNIVEA